MCKSLRTETEERNDLQKATLSVQLKMKEERIVEEKEVEARIHSQYI